MSTFNLTKFTTKACSLLLIMAVCLAGDLVANAQQPSDAVESITIAQPGFEASGGWKFGHNGARVGDLFQNDTLKNYINNGFVDPLPKSGARLAYNNGSSHDLYQVLQAKLAANTTYTLSIDAIDTTFANPFPSGALQLGYVSTSLVTSENAKGNEALPTNGFGRNLIKPIKVDKPIPFNDKANAPSNLTDGVARWTYVFTTGDKPAGEGQPLRIEILGGGKAQSLFDNVRLEARPATLADRKQAARAEAASQSAPAAKVIVMLGDSTTDGGMPAAVKKQLDKLIASKLLSPKVINAGKGGDNATSALDRLEKDVLAHQPDIVTVSFGLNDTGGRKPEQFAASLKEIIKRLHAANVRVVLMTSTPFINEQHGWGEQFKANGGLDEYMNKEFCQRMRSLAEGKAILICDLHAIFKNANKKKPGMINTLVSTDGVHLTGEGYTLVAEHVAPILRKLLTEK